MATITFTGGKELERALRDLGNVVASRLGSNSVRAGARVIAASAKQLVPVRTGALRQARSWATRHCSVEKADLAQYRVLLQQASVVLLDHRSPSGNKRRATRWCSKQR